MLKFFKFRKGGAMSDYGIGIGLIGGIALGAIGGLGGQVVDIINNAGNEVGKQIPGKGNNGNGKPGNGDSGGNNTGGGNSGDPVEEVPDPEPEEEILEILTTSLADAKIGQSYSITMASTNPGSEVLTWQWSADPLPTNFTFNSQTGQLSGTGQIAGTYNIDFTVLNESGDFDTETFSFTVEGVFEKLFPTGGDINFGFGSDVVLDGSRVLIGADKTSLNGNSFMGSAFVFDIIQGEQLNKILPNDLTSSDFFGNAVDIDGSTAIIGAYKNNSKGIEAGAAYMYDINSGSLIKKLEAYDPTTNDGFGYSVAMGGGYIAIGAPFSSSDTGAVYLYTSSGDLIQKITAYDRSSNSRFGYKVQVSGNYLVISAPVEDSGGTNSGAVYVYDPATRAPIYKLKASDRFANDIFGGDISMDGNILLVGANGETRETQGMGAGYLFDLTTGNELHKLIAEDGWQYDALGYSAELEGSYAVLGARGDDDKGSNSGSVYIFDVSSGNQIRKILSPDGYTSDYFGESMSINGGKIAIGSKGADGSATNSGAVYIYDISSDEFLTW